MFDNYNGLEVYQISVDVFDWCKTIFIQLVWCTCGVGRTMNGPHFQKQIELNWNTQNTFAFESHIGVRKYLAN